MAGRRPKPTALKELAGNPGKRPLNPREPKPRPKAPPPPATLSDAEKATYRRLARTLSGMGVVTVADGTALALLAVALTQYWDARAQVTKLGAVVKTAAGNLIQNPYLPVANKAWEQVMRLLSEFGLTPASRSRVQTLDGTGEMSLADLLFADVMDDAE